MFPTLFKFLTKIPWKKLDWVRSQQEILQVGSSVSDINWSLPTCLFINTRATSSQDREKIHWVSLLQQEMRTELVWLMKKCLVQPSSLWLPVSQKQRKRADSRRRYYCHGSHLHLISVGKDALAHRRNRKRVISIQDPRWFEPHGLGEVASSQCGHSWVHEDVPSCLSVCWPNLPSSRHDRRWLLYSWWRITHRQIKAKSVKVHVCHSALTVCRDATLFPNPDTFSPERCFFLLRRLKLDGMVSAARRKPNCGIAPWFLVTDHECVSGKSTKLNDVADNRMAMMEIRLLLSAMILKYESWTGVPDKPGKWDEEMKPYDSLVLQPRNDKCVLRFQRRG